MTDVLPANVQLVSSTAGCSGDPLVVCQAGNLAVGQTAVLTLTVMPTVPGVVTNTAQVTAAEYDNNLANNQSQATTTVLLEMLAVQLNGPEEGITGQMMTFMAGVTPITATQPITYIWQAAGQATVTHTNGLTDAVTFIWALPGDYLVAVTAMNKWDEVTAVHTILIESRLYLPVVLNSSTTSAMRDYQIVSLSDGPPMIASLLTSKVALHKKRPRNSPTDSPNSPA
jgi:hypothetical protein